MAHPLPTEVETLSQLFLWGNTVTEGVFSKLVLMTFWVVITTWLLVTGQEAKGIVVSTGMTLILAMLFQISGFVGGGTVLAILVFFLITVVGSRM